MKTPKARIVRQIKVPTPKVIPIATEKTETKKAILRFNEDAIEVKKHVLTKNLIKFMEGAGIEFEYINVERIRGKTEIHGVPVKVLPIMHTNYDGGAFIQVTEESETSWTNTNKITKLLADHGINWEKECRITEDKVCTIKR